VSKAFTHWLTINNVDNVDNVISRVNSKVIA
ncbi:LuxR family transcriptional regulator, partial [Salmonella enterica subsp. enterica serovar Typhimurium]|nr:LuxR family transcriptional regulator [Salmonella enterica subsp. enterica serovar Typhimurium]